MPRFATRYACLAAALAFATPSVAHAAFETWVFSQPTLPYRLDTVTFSRADRNPKAVEATRDMAERYLRDSRAFRDKAANGLTVELRSVSTSATVTENGQAVGIADILYRVTDNQGWVLFNDRIHTEKTVSVAESIELSQSTHRAARYRAFVANFEALTIALTQTIRPTATPLAGVSIVLDHPLETPRRTTDFAAGLQKVLTPSPTTTLQPSSLTLHVQSLSLQETTAKNAASVDGTVKLGLALKTDDGRTLWHGQEQATATIDRQQALAVGISPRDAAFMQAAQAILSKQTEALAGLVAQNTLMQDVVRDIDLPYRFLDLKSAPHKTDTAAIRLLRQWNQEDGPLASVWRGNNVGLRIQVETLTPRMKRIDSNRGEISLTAVYTIQTENGDLLLQTRQNTQTSFDPADAKAHGLRAGDWALQVGLLDNWHGLLQTLQAHAKAYPPPQPHP